VSFQQPAISIAAGANTSYAVLADGTLRAWGDNASQEYGSTQASSLTPVAVPGITGAVAVTAGDTHACVLFQDHSVKCFGDDSGNQIGVQATTTPQPPTVVAGLLAQKISAAGKMTCAMGMNGDVGCWGQNVLVQTFNTPHVKWAGLSGSVDITTASEGADYIGPDGVVSCVWTVSAGGMCGSGINGATASTSVFGGTQTECALRADGQVWCWGQNLQGFGTTVQAYPAAVVPGLSNVATMALNRSKGTHACAALTTGQVLCTGANDSGQLGTGNTVASTTFAAPVLGVSNVVELTEGAAHTCARTASGDVYCWGANASGQVGDGTVDTRFTAVRVASF
jgi:alpha-tubulin suppressor-like RCC1 family protein